ncbi:hypothetical protein BDZ89DRAFT_1146590 [Hymenopellis radicata]|nr:hypothetical protein BDZ89DRAFT_1146590 [Hymenopellis radicata]
MSTPRKLRTPDIDDDLIVLFTDSEDERASSPSISDKPPQSTSSTLVSAPHDNDNDDLTAAFAALSVASDAGYAQKQLKSQLQLISPKKCPNKKRALTYVVFVGKIPGVYATWDTCEEQIAQETCAIYQGYRSRAIADAAYDHASKRRLVHPTSAPRQSYSSRRVEAPVPVLWTAPTPLSAGLRRQAWYTIFSGTQPGIYNNHIEAAFHHVGIIRKQPLDSGQLRESALNQVEQEQQSSLELAPSYLS